MVASIPADDISLILPDLRFARSYLAARSEGYVDSPHKPAVALDETTVAAHIAALNRPEAIDGEAPVPFAHFWMVTPDELIGRVSIRYALNERLLQSGGHIGYEIRPRYRRQGFGHLALALGIAHLSTRGVTEILVTCRDENAGSARIIEQAGGVLADKVPHLEDPGATMRRYWIRPASAQGVSANPA